MQCHSDLEIGKADMNISGKLIVGKYDSLFIYCFFLCVMLKVPDFFFWMQSLDNVLISSSSDFTFSPLKVRLNFSMNVNVRFELDLF